MVESVARYGSRPMPRIVGAAIALLDSVNRMARFAAGLLLGIATISVAYQILIRFVIDRFGINISAPWTEELARYALIWAIFVGVGAICRSASLISVEILPQALPSRIGTCVKVVSIAITLAFFSALIWVGVGFAAESAIETSPVMRIPMTWVYVAMPIGSMLAVVNLLVLLIEGLFLGRDVIQPDPELTD